jgi:RNA polymerase sigma factor (TIGR02999 family)
MSTDFPGGEVTRMLRQWSRGDSTVVERLTPLVYDELRRLAESYMRRERPDHTLRPTALIHEAYLRLIDQSQPEWRGRSHFFSFAAHLMRQILVDYARARGAGKRGADFQRVTLTGAEAAAPERNIDLVALDEALDRLSAFDERRARVLELRFFGGLTEEETAESLGISVATVRRDLRLAESWLYRELASR